MRKKTVHKKRVKGFFYFKKHLTAVTVLIVFSILAFLLLPNKQKTISGCANSISCINNLSGAYDEENSGEFNGNKITGPALASVPYNQPQLSRLDSILGETTTDNKHIYIDLSSQRLLAYDGNAQVFNFPVSTGKWHYTPTGDFRIWIKLRYTRMKGGDKSIGTFYDLPNVPYTMYFYNKENPKTYGYGIHGAYWHNNFGHPMSHGCVNMRESDVAQLYAWANPTTTGNVTYTSSDSPGTAITIYGTTPQE
jgi:hypothetical protein